MATRRPGNIRPPPPLYHPKVVPSSTARPAIVTAVRLALLLAVLLTAGCGSATTGPSPTRTTTASPPAPDDRRIEVVKAGLGRYQLVVVPVAVLHNASARSTALSVVTHFTIEGPAGQPVGGLDAPPIALAPGQTLGVAGHCTDACGEAAQVAVTLSGATWSTGRVVTVSASQVALACRSGCSPGAGEVTGTLTAREEPAGSPLYVAAACYDAAGDIVGGGTKAATWTSSGTSIPMTVPVILRAPAASCDLYASAA